MDGLEQIPRCAPGLGLLKLLKPSACAAPKKFCTHTHKAVRARPVVALLPNLGCAGFCWSISRMSMPTALQLPVTSGSPKEELACPQRSIISHVERLL